MAEAAYVSSEVIGAGGRSEQEMLRAQLLIQYGDNEEKEAHLEFSLRGVPRNPHDYEEQEQALRELVAALEVWRAESGHIHTTRRTD